MSTIDLAALFTAEEKMSISRILLDIAHADGVFDRKEAEFLSALQLAFGARMDKIDELIPAIFERSVSVSLLTLQKMSKEKKDKLVEMMGLMTTADGVVDESELAIATAIIVAIS